MASANRPSNVPTYLALTGTIVAIVASLLGVYASSNGDQGLRSGIVLIVVVLVLVSAGLVGASIASLRKQGAVGGDDASSVPGATTGTPSSRR